MPEFVVLVDPSDQEVGTAEKLEAHRRGLLHRAISVFLFDRDGRLLLQRRGAEKYHAAGLWSNTCCGHPRPGEPPARAAARRLEEEMGLDCPVRSLGQVRYRAAVSDDLVEHELDHVFVGRCDRDPSPDSHEVSGWEWVALDALQERLDRTPARFTPWLPILLERLPALRRAAELEEGAHHRGIEERA
jgi:isopentenyl-diphosphate delta-isomerase